MTTSTTSRLIALARIAADNNHPILAIRLLNSAYARTTGDSSKNCLATIAARIAYTAGVNRTYNYATATDLLIARKLAGEG